MAAGALPQRPRLQGPRAALPRHLGRAFDRDGERYDRWGDRTSARCVWCVGWLCNKGMWGGMVGMVCGMVVQQGYMGWDGMGWEGIVVFCCVLVIGGGEESRPSVGFGDRGYDCGDGDGDEMVVLLWLMVMFVQGKASEICSMERTIN